MGQFSRDKIVQIMPVCRDIYLIHQHEEKDDEEAWTDELKAVCLALVKTVYFDDNDEDDVSIQAIFLSQNQFQIRNDYEDDFSCTDTSSCIKIVER